MKKFLLIALFSVGLSYCNLGSNLGKQAVTRELQQGLVYYKPIIELFEKGELQKVQLAFAEMRKSQVATPIMNIMGYYYVSSAYERMNKFDSVLLYEDSSIYIFNNLQLTKIVPEEYANVLLHKAATLFRLHQPEKANQLFFEIKKSTENTNNIQFQYSIVEQLGYISFRQKNYRESLSNFQEAFSLYQILDPRNYYKQTELVSNIGECFFYLGNYDSSKIAFNKALDILEQHKDNIATYLTSKASSLKAANTSKGVVLGNLAKLYDEMGLIDTAISLSKQSIELNSNEYGEQRDAQMVAIRLVDIYLKSGRLQNAHLLMNRILLNLEKLPDVDAYMNLQRQLSVYYEKIQQPEKAFPYLKAYQKTKDSISIIAEKEMDNNIVKDLEIRNQENTNRALKHDFEVNRNYLFSIFAFAIMACVIIVLIFKNYQRSKENVTQLTQLNTEINIQKTQIELALSELEKSDKEKDRILQIVAHDLRSPISGIAALSKMVLQEQVELGEDTIKSIDMIHRTSSNSLVLINELLNANTLHAKSLDTKNVDVNHIVADCLQIMLPKANDKFQKLNATLLNEKVMILVDKEQIGRVMQNLLYNAIKFTAIAGRIDLIIEKQQEKMICISIKDNGIGIPIEFQDQVFKMFSNAMRKGTEGEKSFGIGLSVCKKIVEAHGGKIWFESQENKGTCFNICLPIA